MQIQIEDSSQLHSAFQSNYNPAFPHSNGHTICSEQVKLKSTCATLARQKATSLVLTFAYAPAMDSPTEKGKNSWKCTVCKSNLLQFAQKSSYGSIQKFVAGVKRIALKQWIKGKALQVLGRAISGAFHLLHHLLG
jgi:hypothetical protein